MQELLEILGIPYTGSGVLACIRCMDKVLAKHLLVEAGVPTPEFFAFSELAFRELGAAEALPQIEERLAFPIVVKPAAQGSALGIKFARTAEDVPAALVNAFSYDDKVLLERHVDGRELAVSMIERTAHRTRCRSSRRCRATRTSSTSSRATRSAAPSTAARPSSTGRGDGRGRGGGAGDVVRPRLPRLRARGHHAARGRRAAGARGERRRPA